MEDIVLWVPFAMYALAAILLTLALVLG